MIIRNQHGLFETSYTREILVLFITKVAKKIYMVTSRWRECLDVFDKVDNNLHDKMECGMNEPTTSWLKTRAYNMALNW